MKKTATAAIGIFFTLSLSAQEALKSTEEEYYDFLSLTGVVERPTLGYRTLSDSVWNFNEVSDFMKNEDGTFTLVRTDGKESGANIWKNNNLGTVFTLHEATGEAENWFTRGLNRNIRFRLYGPEWYNSYNTAAPYGQNDGALWQGKGYNTSFTAGARLEAYGFEITFKPQVSFSQNLDYSYLPGVFDSEYSYFWYSNIDLVQRYGDSPFWTFDWGDTEIRYSWHTLTIGFGTQSPWLGPAYLNPMLGSNNAASYPKVDAGLRRTKVYLPYFNYYVGDIEGRIWTGMLTTSDYFLNSTYDKHHMLNAMSASFAPSFLPNLTIGMNRIYITKWKLKNLSYLTRFITMSKANDWVGDGEDGKISLFANWVLNKIGFEAYGEYGIDDFPTRYDVNPFHTAVYTVGVKQIIPITHNKIIKGELFLEFNNFEMSQDFQFQWPYGGYYSHGQMLQGYTNKGQILGAGSGYAGNSQFLGFRLLYPAGSSFLYYHRSCPDNNYIYSQAVGAAITDENIHKQSFKTIIAAGFEQQLFIKSNLLISFGGAIIKIQYADYNKNSPTYGFNVNTSLKYNF